MKPEKRISLRISGVFAVEISKRRIAATIVDDPEFSATVLKPAKKATPTKKKGE